MTDPPNDSEKRIIRPKFEVMEGGNNHIERMARGGFVVFWHGKPVYEKGRIKRFKTGSDAPFLARCDVRRQNHPLVGDR
jgi:hypothetical protein